MEFPGFFAEAPSISLRDPLAQFLGASKSGMITYAYVDAVRLAGHSCPTVAGAYLMVRRGLQLPYDSEMPERGGIEAYLRGPCDQGTAGVVAAVVTLVTGAAPETGFRGIGSRGRFARRDLLHFDATFDGVIASANRQRLPCGKRQGRDGAVDALSRIARRTGCYLAYVAARDGLPDTGPG